jgi:hypothetical protein
MQTPPQPPPRLRSRSSGGGDIDDTIRVDAVMTPVTPYRTLGTPYGGTTPTPSTPGTPSTPATTGLPLVSHGTVHKGLVCVVCSHVVSRCHTCGHRFTDATQVSRAASCCGCGTRAGAAAEVPAVLPSESSLPFHFRARA